MVHPRKVEVFIAGCFLCDEAVAKLKAYDFNSVPFKVLISLLLKTEIDDE